jgi:hypothetical protein
VVANYIIITKIHVRVDLSIVTFERIVVASSLGSSKSSAFMGPLTLGLLTGYKTCPGLFFSSAVLGALEKKKSYQFSVCSLKSP